MANKSSIISISNFSGGISDSPRKNSVSEFQITKHFDVFTDPTRLIPYRSLEADTETSVSATDLKQYFVRDFLYASASAKLYGLGQTGAGNTKIVYKDSAISGLWTLPATSEGNGAVKNGCFVEFKDYLWGFQGTNQLFKWGLLSGTPSITNSALTVGATITSVAQGLIASDGSLYLPYNNKLVRVAPGLTTTDAVISVPDNFKITSIANRGNYMAIGCAPIASYNGVSKVFIWNLASDLFTETINFGEGDLRVLEVVEGLTVGIVDRYLNNTTGAGTGSMVILVDNGSGSAQVVKEIFTKALTGKTIPISKAVKNNRLFWSAKIMTNSAGTEYNEGIWSFGRKNSNYPYVTTLDVVCEEVNTSGIEGFTIAGNFFVVSHSADGSISKTNDASTYTYTSAYESQIFNFGDSGEKQLKQISIYTAPIPTGGSATVKYRVDGATAWTTIGTYSTVGGLARDFFNIEATGVDFASFREVEFRLESAGGTELTGYKIIASPYIGSL